MSSHVDCLRIVGHGKYPSSGDLYPHKDPRVYRVRVTFWIRTLAVLWIYIHVRTTDHRMFPCVQSYLQLVAFRSSVCLKLLFIIGSSTPATRHRLSRTSLSFTGCGGPAWHSPHPRPPLAPPLHRHLLHPLPSKENGFPRLGLSAQQPSC